MDHRLNGSDPPKRDGLLKLDHQRNADVRLIMDDQWQLARRPTVDDLLIVDGPRECRRRRLNALLVQCSNNRVRSVRRDQRHHRPNAWRVQYSHDRRLSHRHVLRRRKLCE